MAGLTCSLVTFQQETDKVAHRLPAGAYVHGAWLARSLAARLTEGSRAGEAPPRSRRRPCQHTFLRVERLPLFAL